MSITVLSTAKISSPPASQTSSANETAPASGFAALLGEQVSATLGKALPSGELTTPESSALTPEQLAELAASNPALASQLATGLTPTPSATPLPREASPSSQGKPLPILSELTEKAAGKVAGEALLSEISNATQSLGKAEPGQDFAAQLSKALQPAPQAPTTPLSPPVADNTTGTNAALLAETGKAAGLGNESANIAGEASTATPATLTTSLVSNNQSNAHSNETAQAHIPTPINEPRWAHDFGEKIVWLAKTEQQTAQISINPPQLGPMQISISLNGDQASAAFASPHASVRQALEQAMPHLREMLTSAGISLNDASVSTQLPQQNRDNSQQFTNTPSNRTPFADENAILSGDIKASASLPIQRGRGLVDLFA